MTKTEPTIEAEVVEIDGVAVEPRPATKANGTGTRSEWGDWKKWQGRAMKLDARWWPLWLILGFIALVLIVAVGMCALVLWVVYKLTVGLFVGFLSLFVSPTELQRR